MKIKSKHLILSILAIVSLLVITSAVTYAFFNYAKEGTTDNVITTGSITFLYTEVSGVGNGINIENAFPISDEVGKVQTGDGEYFDFKITSDNTGNAAIPYEVTARKSTDSDDIDEYIRVYLTKGSEEVLLDNYSNLTQTLKVSEDKYTEKTIYTGKVPSNTTDYEETFRLRMWIDEDTRFDNVDMNNKTFTLTVNVYANAKVVTDEEIALESSTAISSLSVDDVELPVVEGQDYDYETTLEEGTTSTTINIETENPNATVNIEKIDSLAISSNVKRLAVTKTLELTGGENYFKVIVMSENKEATQEYKIRIIVETNYKTYSIGDAVTAIDGSKWHVLEASDENTETVVLLSDYNLNTDGSYNTECGRDINSTLVCSTILFDPNDTNTYDETDSNNIGYFIKNTYAPKVIAALPGTTNVTLPTAYQLATADGQTFLFNQIDISSSWLTTTVYWTKTAAPDWTAGVWILFANAPQLSMQNAKCTYSHVGQPGARPVITTPKSNLIAE